MVATPKRIKLDPESGFVQLLKEVAAESTVIEADGERFRVTREDSTDIFANYDPERALVAIQGMFGTLPDGVAQELKAELRELRDQDSMGIPA